MHAANATGNVRYRAAVSSLRKQRFVRARVAVFEKGDRKIVPPDRFYQPGTKLIAAQSPDDTANYTSQQTSHRRMAGEAEGGTAQCPVTSRAAKSGAVRERSPAITPIKNAGTHGGMSFLLHRRRAAATFD
jgi:hypothetical protein